MKQFKETDLLASPKLALKSPNMPQNKILAGQSTKRRRKVGASGQANAD